MRIRTTWSLNIWSKGLIIALCLPLGAMAQTGVGLWVRPLEGHFEGRADVTIFNGGGTSPGAGGANLQRVDTQGRWQYDVEDQRGVKVGFQTTHINIESNNPLLPERLSSVELAAGFAIGEYEGWLVDAVVGGGYAGTNPFGDGGALYGTVDVIATLRIDDKKMWQIGINYDGNRTFLPDVPLPGVAFTHQVTPEFQYIAGFPALGLTWTPDEKLTVRLISFVFQSINIKAEYKVDDALTVFCNLRETTEAFTLDIPRSHQRILFEQSLAEVGARYKVCAQGTIEFAAGYAWNRDMEVGFDVRDTTNLVSLSDEPFVRIGLQIRE